MHLINNGIHDRTMHLLRNVLLITLIAILVSLNGTPGMFVYRSTPYQNELTFKKPELDNAESTPTANDEHDISFLGQTPTDDKTSKPNNNGSLIKPLKSFNVQVYVFNNYASLQLSIYIFFFVIVAKNVLVLNIV